MHTYAFVLHCLTMPLARCERHVLRLAERAARDRNLIAAWAKMAATAPLVRKLCARRSRCCGEGRWHIGFESGQASERLPEWADKHQSACRSGAAKWSGRGHCDHWMRSRRQCVRAPVTPQIGVVVAIRRAKSLASSDCDAEDAALFGCGPRGGAIGMPTGSGRVCAQGDQAASRVAAATEAWGDRHTEPLTSCERRVARHVVSRVLLRSIERGEYTHSRGTSMRIIGRGRFPAVWADGLPLVLEHRSGRNSHSASGVRMHTTATAPRKNAPTDAHLCACACAHTPRATHAPRLYTPSASPSLGARSLAHSGRPGFQPPSSQIKHGRCGRGTWTLTSRRHPSPTSSDPLPRTGSYDKRRQCDAWIEHVVIIFVLEDQLGWHLTSRSPTHSSLKRCQNWSNPRVLPARHSSMS